MTRTEELLALIENTKRAERIRPARKSTLSTELIENNTIEQLVELARLQNEVMLEIMSCGDWSEHERRAIAAFNKFEGEE